MKIKNKGFTLLEILLGITLIGVLASIAFTLINPNLRLAQSRDLNRQKDITDIQQALELYATRNSGDYPAGIVLGSYKEICGQVISSECVDLGTLIPQYLSYVPKDPSGNNYKIGINPNNKIISIWAAKAESREVSINIF